MRQLIPAWDQVPEADMLVYIGAAQAGYKYGTTRALEQTKPWFNQLKATYIEPLWNEVQQLNRDKVNTTQAGGGNVQVIHRAQVKSKKPVEFNGGKDVSFDDWLVALNLYLDGITDDDSLDSLLPLLLQLEAMHKLQQETIQKQLMAQQLMLQQQVGLQPD